MKYKRLLFLSTVIIVLILSSVSFAAIPIDVTVGKETILNLKVPSKRVSIADPDVAGLVAVAEQRYSKRTDNARRNHGACSEFRRSALPVRTGTPGYGKSQARSRRLHPRRRLGLLAISVRSTIYLAEAPAANLSTFPPPSRYPGQSHRHPLSSSNAAVRASIIPRESCIRRGWPHQG